MSTSSSTRTHEATLAIGGMTCASCSSRVERKLNKLDGVEATVNLVTEKAHVRYDEPTTADDLLAAVSSTGYTASLVSRQPTPGRPKTEPATSHLRDTSPRDTSPRHTSLRHTSPRDTSLRPASSRPVSSAPSSPGAGSSVLPPRSPDHHRGTRRPSRHR